MDGRMGGRLPGARLSGLAIAAPALACALLSSGEAHAFCSVLSHQPCAPYVGSVLRHRPFTPYSCGVSGGPCSPEVVLVAGEAPVLRLVGHDGPAEPPDRDRPLEVLRDVAQTLSKCLELPSGGASLPGMEVAVRLAFKRDGELMPVQRFTYAPRGAAEDVKAAYHTAVMDMLRRCTPLVVSDALGGAMAGHPLVLALRDVRGVVPEAPQTDKK